MVLAHLNRLHAVRLRSYLLLGSCKSLVDSVSLANLMIHRFEMSNKAKRDD